MTPPGSNDEPAGDPGVEGSSDAYAAQRRDLRRRLAPRIGDERVLDAIEEVPRHAFVPPDRRADAYHDRPLPIGDDQTISAPHMVAIMLDVLALDPGDCVLEIGTGCGYHAAVTAELVGDDHVYSVEYGQSLATGARDRFAELGYDGISVRVGDGRDGWEAYAPYDVAYVTCAVPDPPECVADQLRTGGQLLAPIGRTRQTLTCYRRGEDGLLGRSEHGAVRFVPVRG